MGKVIARQMRGMGWKARISLVMIVTLLTSIFIHEGWYLPRSGLAATVNYYFKLDSSAVNVGVDGSTNTAITTDGSGKFSMVQGVGVPTPYVTSLSTRTGTGAAVTIATFYGPQYASTTYLNNPALQIAAARSSSNVTFAATIYDYDPVGGTSTALWTTGSGTASSSSVRNVALAISSPAQKSIASGHRIKIVVTENVASGNTASIGYNYSATYYSYFSVLETAGPLPTVTSVSAPASLPQGASNQNVVINGTNFVSGSGLAASFSGTGITVNSTTYNSPTQVTANVTVAAAAATGTRSVTVTNPDGGSGTGSNVFTVNAAPTVTSFNPASLFPGQGPVSVTITGTNFVSGAGVSFGPGITVSSPTVSNSTTMTANLTVDIAATPGFRTVTVTNPDNGAGSNSTGFQVVSASTPTISGLSQSSIGQGASSVAVTVTGSNFDASSTLTCSNPGVTIATSYVSSTRLTATISVGSSATAGAANLTVTNSPSGDTSTSTGALTVTARPTVTSISPVNGRPGDTNKSVTITGTGFVAGSPLAASLSGSGVTLSNVTWQSATQLTATMNIDPAAAAGARTITVVNGDNGVSAAGGSFTVVTAPAPTISSLSTSTLSSYASNFTITIKGSNFLNAPVPTVSCTGVTFGTVTYLDSSTLTVVVNSNTNTSGTGTLTVTNNDTQAATTTISFNNLRPGSTITASPTVASAGLTANITITGSSFQNGAVASFSNAGITVTGTSYLSATQLVAAISVSPSATGTSTITVTNPDGGTRTSGTGALTITPVGVQSVSPASLGQGAQNVNLTITGLGFTAASTVSFSNSGITVNSLTYNSATSLTANVSIAASAATGSSDLTVTTGANYGVGSGVITITGAPTVSSISPAVQQGDSHDTVTINGGNFQSGATVAFNGGGIKVNSATFVSASQLRLDVSVDALAAVGNHSVTIVNPDGGIITGGALSVALANFTTPGTMTFRAVSANSITVFVPFNGDGNGNNGCSIRWGSVAGSYPNTVTATRSAGGYTATLTGLPAGSDGAGNLYFFQATFSDPDGVNGASQLVGFTTTLGSPLMHNSQNLGSSKWPQGWGVGGGKYGAFTCSTCHSRSTFNAKMVRTAIQSPSLENWSSAGTSNVVSVLYRNPATDLGNDAAHATSTNVCEVCHQRTSHHLYKNAAANHYGAADCTQCHGHDQGFSPDSKGGRDCSLCHGDLATPMKSGTTSYHHHVDGSAVASASYPTSGTPADSQKSCLQCHVDHDLFRADLNSANTGGRAANLRLDATVAPAAGAAAANSDFVAGAAKGGVCTSCHLNQQARSSVQKASGSTVTITVDPALFALSMHNYTASSVFKKDGSLFLANCSKCHNDTTAKSRQLASGNQFGNHDSTLTDINGALGIAAPSDPLEETLCFRCHSRASEKITGGGVLKDSDGVDWYGSRTMAANSIDTFASFYNSVATSPTPKGYGHQPASYSGLHKSSPAEETLDYLAANKHVGCGDCHNPHTAKGGSNPAGSVNGNLGSPALTGATGVSITSSGWSGVWTAPARTAYASGGTTSNPMGTASYEWQVCMKCHSGAISTGNGWFKNMTTGTGALRWTDVGLEFNPNNKSFHPVVASLGTNKLAASQLIAPWVTNAGTQTMGCSDCHATDSSGGSLGPHGSSVKWMLAGPNRAWPYTSAASNGGTSQSGFYLLNNQTTNKGTKDGLFCLNCHPSTTSQNSAHNESKHNKTPCVYCHIRVPHGGKVARLISTKSAGTVKRYAPDGNGNWANIDPGDGNTYNPALTVFKKAATPTGYSQSGSCQGCYHGSAVTGGDAW